MVEIKRKRGENFEGFLRRFNKRLQQSGRLYQAKKIRFRQPKKSKSLKKQSALVKLKKQKQHDYLRKVGKLKDDFMDRFGGRRRRR